jgi:hypothetical protein
MNRITPAAMGAVIFASLCLPGFAIANGGTAMRHAIPASEHKVAGIYMNAGNANEEQISPDVYTTVDQGTITCTKPTCTLALSAMQETESADESGEWRIVALVDGNPVDGGPWQGPVPLDNIYLIGNWQGAYAVVKGSHTVTFQIYSQASLQLDQWSDTATVTTP